MYSYSDLIEDTKKKLDLKFHVVSDGKGNRVVIILSGLSIIIHQYETHENSCIESHYVSETQYRTKTESYFIYDITIQLDYEKFYLDKY